MRFPWLQVDSDFLATGAGDLSEVLRTSEAEAGWSMVRLWGWAVSKATSAEDLGVLDGETMCRLAERAAGWKGEQGAFLAALCDPAVRLAVTEDGGIIRLSGLERYASTLEKMAKDKARKAAGRRKNVRAASTGRPADIQRKTQTQIETQTQKEEALPGSEPRPPVSDISADDLPDATDHAELEPNPSAVPNSSGNPPAKPESSPPDWPPALRLEVQAAPKAARTRKPSAAERLYLQLEETRRQRCEEAGVDFVAEDWAPARQNTSLGRFARLQPAEQERFEAAWAEYLSDDSGASRNPPWSVGWFLASKSTWESKALRGAS